MMGWRGQGAGWRHGGWMMRQWAGAGIGERGAGSKAGCEGAPNLTRGVHVERITGVERSSHGAAAGNVNSRQIWRN